MKKFLIILSAILLVSGTVKAYEPVNYRWNITPGYFFTFGGADLAGFVDNDLGSGFSLEGSYRLDSGLELGAYASISAFDRNYSFLSYEDFVVLNSVDFMQTNIMATANYNYRTSRYIELFGGVGLGWMYAEKDRNIIVPDGVEKSCNSLAVMPRVGVRVRSHLKFSVGYKFQEKANKYAFVSIGYTFGIKKF